MDSGIAEKPTTGEGGSTRLSAVNQELDYRPVSNLAVVALLGSIISLTSFYSIFMILLAVVMLLFSAIISFRLDSAQKEYSGQFVAKLAVFIALLASLGGATAHAVTYYVLTKDARQFGETYLQTLLTDDLEQAFLLRVHPIYRTQCNNDPKELTLRYNKEFEDFKQEWTTRQVRAGGSKAKITFVSNSGIENFMGMDYVLVVFRVDIPGENPRSCEVRLGLHGGVSRQGDWAGRQWYVYNNDDAIDLEELERSGPTPEATGGKL